MQFWTLLISIPDSSFQLPPPVILNPVIFTKLTVTRRVSPLFPPSIIVLFLSSPIKVNLLYTTTFSAYVPAYTNTVSPLIAKSIASWMLVYAPPDPVVFT